MSINNEVRKTAIVISCSDSRLESTISRLRMYLAEHPIQEVSDASYFFRIQVPGPDGALLGQRGDDHKKVLLEDIRLLIANAKASALIFIPHCDCVGCQVSDETHQSNCLLIADILYSEFKLPVLALLDHQDSQSLKEWHFELVTARIE